MTDGLEAVTTSALALALDAASMRQQVIAANIANANVTGYVPMRVSFESQLEDARRTLDSHGRLDATALTDIEPRLETNADAGAIGVSPKVMLDLEVAHLAQNGVQYQALVTGLARHYSILTTAVNDGRK